MRSDQFIVFTEVCELNPDSGFQYSKIASYGPFDTKQAAEDEAKKRRIGHTFAYVVPLTPPS